MDKTIEETTMSPSSMLAHAMSHPKVVVCTALPHWNACQWCDDCGKYHDICGVWYMANYGCPPDHCNHCTKAKVVPVDAYLSGGLDKGNELEYVMYDDKMYYPMVTNKFTGEHYNSAFPIKETTWKGMMEALKAKGVHVKSKIRTRAEAMKHELLVPTHNSPRRSNVK